MGMCSRTLKEMTASNNSHSAGAGEVTRLWVDAVSRQPRCWAT